ncbi:MAG: hypothetical protein IJT69_05140 [Clostridia bacterium]|nr:hypothetical protein [Clostridia bacterium]
MNETLRKNLLESVKKDDVKGFGTMMTPEVLCAVFGRFPLLSLLYLYDAKRIVKSYFAELVKERPRVKVDPYREAEERFRLRAGKALRYYADEAVSPLEMLAIMGRGRELKKLYAVYPNAGRYLPAIHRVYFTRLGKGVSATGPKLDLPAEPLSYAARRFSLRFALVCFAAFLLIAVTTVCLSVYFGLGNDRVFYKVRSGAALASALRENETVYLKKDVTLSATVETYGRKFEGNDRIVRLSAPLCDRFEGEMFNVIFVLEQSFVGDAVIRENVGVLRNVRVVAEGVTLAKGGEHMGLLTSVNAGTIDGCYATLSVEIAGDAGGDCYFAPFAGSNEGAIHACRAEGSIEATDVDVAGIAGKNEKTGVITDCVVDMTLSERADIKGWTPNVAGIADHNEGAIDGCSVAGTVRSVLASPELAEGDRVVSAYAAGLVCVNVGSVQNSTNRAAVTADATYGSAFAGGIVTLNTTLTDDPTAYGTVTRCSGLGAVSAVAHTDNNSYAGGIAAVNDSGSYVSASRQTARVSAESPDRYYDFTGGIAARNAGNIESCFFTGSLPEYDEDSLVGAICGLCYLRGGFFANYTIDLSGNAYVASEGHTSGGVIAEYQFYYLRPDVVYTAYFFENTQGYGDYATEILDFGASSVTLEQLKAMEIYYE